MSRKKELSEDVKRLLKNVVAECDIEDRSVRERQLRTWRRLKLAWEGISNVWYSEVAHDWRIWDQEYADDGDQSAYDKPVNVFRAYLESIIAALSVTVPPVKCYPDDADNTLDLITAKTGDKIAELIYRHNDVTLLWLHALFIYCTEGMVACYSYPKASLEYGSYEQKEYEDYDEQHEQTVCSSCGFVLEDTILNPLTGEQEPNPEAEVSDEVASMEQNEFAPGDEDAELHAALNMGQELCPACMSMMDPELRNESFITQRLVGTTDEPKSRVCLEAYGGLNIKIPSYARRQSECPYLQYAYETHYGIAIEEFEHLAGDTEVIKSMHAMAGATAGAYDQYDEWARLSPQYNGEYPTNVVTIKHTWLRPAAYNVLQNQDDIDQLKELFPDGCKVSMVNDCFGKAVNEALDDCWTITHNPLADYVHYDPLGLLLVSIQEITNDLLSLTLQTIEHGIGQTFADPAVLSFKAYNQTEVTPGGIFPAQAKSGKTLGEGSNDLKTATLSPEVLPFAQQIQNLGQLVSGALPSLFGGQLEGSETASEYSMSRAQALQRLQNTWKMFNIWWKTIFGKAIPMFIDEMQTDERDVKRNADGSFFNVFIRRAELEGKIGKVEIEANENLPLTWSQKKDIVMQLLQAANPEILAILGAPENLPIIRDAIGLTDFFVPGEDEVEATYDDIKALLGSEPHLMPPPPQAMEMAVFTGAPPPQEQEVPSIQPDPDIDNPDLRFRILRGWLQSEAGRQARVDNEAGYKNVLLYAKAYKMLMMPPPLPPGAAPEGNGAPPNKKPTKLEMQPEAPITGESNVATAS